MTFAAGLGCEALLYREAGYANAANQTDDGSPFLGFMHNEGNELGTGYAYLDLGSLVIKHKTKIFGIYGKEDGLFSGAHLDRIESLMLPGRMTRVGGASHAVYIHQQAAFLSALSAAATKLAN